VDKVSWQRKEKLVNHILRNSWILNRPFAVARDHVTRRDYPIPSPLSNHELAETDGERENSFAGHWNISALSLVYANLVVGESCF
jgi:hypothetical protein